MADSDLLELRLNFVVKNLSKRPENTTQYVKLKVEKVKVALFFWYQVILTSYSPFSR